MAEFKDIAKFSSDAITQAMCTSFSNAEERQSFNTKLGVIKSLLENIPKSPKDKKHKTATMTEKEVFERFIIPSIRNKIVEFEHLEHIGRGIPWEVKLDFKTDFVKMSVAEMKIEHSKIVAEENCLQNIDLVIKYYRGLLYLSAYNYAERDMNCRKWFSVNFGVSYMTALRYMTVALLLKKYPRLLVCGLTYAQLIKHIKHLETFLKSETEGMRERLALSVDVKVQRKDISLSSADNVVIPTQKFSTDPDSMYHEDPTDIKGESQLEEFAASGGLTEVLEQEDAFNDLGKVFQTLKMEVDG